MHTTNFFVFLSEQRGQDSILCGQISMPLVAHIRRTAVMSTPNYVASSLCMIYSGYLWSLLAFLILDVFQDGSFSSIE
jgi:hypothetical protein